MIRIQLTTPKRSHICWACAFGLAVLCQACQLPIPSTVSKREANSDHDKAVIKDCETLPPSKVDKANQYFSKAEKELDSMRYQSAIQNYSLAIDSDPAFSHAYAARGVAQKKSGNFREAISDYKKAIDYHPRIGNQDECLLDNIGNAYARLEEFSTALSYHDMAHELSPNNSTILSNRGTTRILSGDYAGALRDYRKSLALKPDDNFSILNIGQALLFEGKPEESIQYFTQAIDQYQRPMDYSGRGLAYLRLDETELACSDWKIAIEKGMLRLSEQVKKYCNE